MPKFVSKRKSCFKSSDKALRSQLQHFVKETNGFVKSSYGEIQFKGQGSRSTYSPYVTCTPSAAPDAIWRLLTNEWSLRIPNIVISVSGVFYKRDYEWLEVMGGTWLVTNGSSPTHQSTFNASSIAVIEMRTVDDKQVLYGTTDNGCFPAPYQTHKTTRHQKKLDQSHTHFIFVEGDKASAADFRNRILAFISTVPIEIDAGATTFVSIPIISVLVSDEAESLMCVARAANDGYPVVVMSSAAAVKSLVDNSRENGYSSDKSFKAIQQLTSDLCFKEERTFVKQCLAKWTSSDSQVNVHTSSKYSSLREMLLHAVVSCNRYAVKSKVRLAMTWNDVDTFKSLLSPTKNFDGDVGYLSTYLLMALSVGRIEFLEYIENLGIDLYSCVTVKMLWFLYYEALHTEQYETEMINVLHKYLENCSLNATDLLFRIGRIISHLTKHEVTGLYSEDMYKHQPHGRGNLRHRRAMSSINLTAFEDESPQLEHPQRDLFLWCVLTGKSNIAMVFWRNGHSLVASALVASAIYKSEADEIDFKTHDSALAEQLTDQSKFWSNLAIEFTSASYKARRGSTLCMLTQRLPYYGGCSPLYLAYMSKARDFISQPAAQSALDYIWLGKTKKDQTFWKKTLALWCPYLVPFLDLLERKNHFVPTVSEVYQSTFTEVVEEDNSDPENGIGGMVYFIQNTQVSGENRYNEKPKTCLSYVTQYIQDVFDYFNSPASKFFMHSLYLILHIVIMSFSLLVRSDDWSLPPSARIASIFVLIYMAGLCIDEIRQILSEENVSGCRRLRNWISNSWNRLDFIMISCYFTGQIMILVGVKDENEWYAAMILLSIALLSMYLRCFQIYLVFPGIGPKIYMMSRMLRDLTIFLSIMALVFFCYGVILTSLSSLEDTGDHHMSKFDEVHNFTDFVLQVYNHILREPYWQIYSNALGTAEAPQRTLMGVVRALVTAFYLLFSNIMMVNLLIAMFSYTFQNIQDNANVFWKFHRFDVVREFWDRPWLPSPFIIIEDVVRAVQWCRRRTPHNHAFKRNVSKEQEESLWDFEQEILAQITKEKLEEKKAQNVVQEDIKKMIKEMIKT